MTVHSELIQDSMNSLELDENQDDWGYETSTNLGETLYSRVPHKTCTRIAKPPRRFADS